MSATTNSTDSRVVKEYCAKIVKDKQRADFVNVKDVVDDEKVNEHFSKIYTEHGVKIAVGSILTKVPWATRYRDGTYKIDENIA